METITNSFEGRKQLDRLRQEINKIPYNPDVRKLYENCDQLLHKFGSAEVEARRTKQPKRCAKQLEDFVQAATLLEKVILLVKLSV